MPKGFSKRGDIRDLRYELGNLWTAKIRLSCSESGKEIFEQIEVKIKELQSELDKLMASPFDEYEICQLRDMMHWFFDNSEHLELLLKKQDKNKKEEE